MAEEAEGSDNKPNKTNILNSLKSKANHHLIDIRTKLAGQVENVKSKFEGVVNKVKRKSDGHERPPEASGNIFVTRSSADFEKIKSERTESPFVAYPIIAASAIAIPYALHQAGICIGLLLIILSAIMTEYSEALLVQCSIMAEETSLQGIGKKVYGKIGLIVTTIFPCLYTMSVITTYNAILADLSLKIFHSLFRHSHSNILMQRRSVLTLMCLMTVPIATTTNVKRIFTWSLASLVSASFVALFVTVRYFTFGNQIQSHYQIFFSNNILQAFAVLTLCFSCQHTCRLYYANIDKNIDRIANKPSNTASSYSLLCTLLLGIAGYATFKEYTQSNILENFCDGDNYATLARCFYAAFVVCLYPLECQTLRQLIQQIVVVHKRFDQVFNIFITVAILLPPYFAAFMTDCLDEIIEVAGFLFAIPLVYIIPSILFLNLSPNANLLKVEKIPCLVTSILGGVISICGITVTLFTPHKCAHDAHDFPYCNSTNGNLLGPLITLVSLNKTDDVN